MPLLRKKFGYGVSEFDLETQIIHAIERQDLWEFHLEGKRKIYRQIHLPYVSRRSDIVVYWRGKYYNVEVKLTAVASVLAQALDHQRWCDYSYICMPADVYMPPGHQKIMISKGVGLLLFETEHQVLIEAIQAKYNSRSKDRIIMLERTINILKEIDQFNRNKQLKNNQLSIELNKVTRDSQNIEAE